MIRKLLTTLITDKPFYRHFKGKWYYVLRKSVDSETGRLDVVYIPLYELHDAYHREYNMFLSETDHVKYPKAEQKYRFMTIKELNTQFAQEYTSKLIAKELLPLLVKDYNHIIDLQSMLGDELIYSIASSFQRMQLK